MKNIIRALFAILAVVVALTATPTEAAVKKIYQAKLSGNLVTITTFTIDHDKAGKPIASTKKVVATNRYEIAKTCSSSMALEICNEVDGVAAVRSQMNADGWITGFSYDLIRQRLTVGGVVTMAWSK